MSKIIPIPNFSDYGITKEGCVYSYITNKWLKMCLDDVKYPRVSLRKDNKFFGRRVHCLVLETFVGPCPEGMECRHLDGVRHHNDLSNLCWGTRSENRKDSLKHGTLRGFFKSGEKHPHSKLTETDVKQIIYFGKGKITQRKLADIFNVSNQNINDIIRERTWKHVKILF